MKTETYVSSGAGVMFSVPMLWAPAFERTGSYDRLWILDTVLTVGAALTQMPIRETPKLRPALASPLRTPVLAE